MEKERINYIKQELLTAEDVIRRRSGGNIIDYVDSVTADALANGILSCHTVKELYDFSKMALYKNIPDINGVYINNVSLYFIIRYVFNLDFVMVAEPDEKRVGVKRIYDFIYSPEFLDIEWYRRACENIISVFHVCEGTAVLSTGFQYIDPTSDFAKSFTDGEETLFSACMRRTLLLCEKNADILHNYTQAVHDYVSEKQSERIKDSTTEFYNGKVQELVKQLDSKTQAVSDAFINDVLEKLHAGAEKLEQEVDLWNFDEVIEKSNEFARAYCKNPCANINLMSGIFGTQSSLFSTNMATKSTALYYAGYIDETVLLNVHFLNFCEYLNEYHGSKSTRVITESQQRIAFAIYKYAFFCLGLCNLTLGRNSTSLAKLFYSTYDNVFKHGYRIVYDESGVRQFKKQG